MNLIMKHLMMILALKFIIISLILKTSKKSIMDTQKSSPFECGFEPMSNKRLPFSIHFFLISVIFLIFDIEIIIIMPMILASKSSIMKYWMMTFTSFIIVIMMGLYHEWYNGMLNWTK